MQGLPKICFCEAETTKPTGVIAGCIKESFFYTAYCLLHLWVLWLLVGYSYFNHVFVCLSVCV